MAEQQFKVSNSVTEFTDTALFCQDSLNKAAGSIGYKSFDDYFDSLATAEERSSLWKEYERLVNGEPNNKKTITIPEGLCQSNNLNHLFTVM